MAYTDTYGPSTKYGPKTFKDTHDFGGWSSKWGQKYVGGGLKHIGYQLKKGLEWTRPKAKRVGKFFLKHPEASLDLLGAAASAAAGNYWGAGVGVTRALGRKRFNKYQNRYSYGNRTRYRGYTGRRTYAPKQYRRRYVRYNRRYRRRRYQKRIPFWLWKKQQGRKRRYAKRYTTYRY